MASESVVDVNVQSVPVTTADPSDVAPSNTSTVVPASVVPSIVGVSSFVVPSAVVITGAVVFGMLMVYTSVFGDSSFPFRSLAKNLSVVVVLIGIGLEYVRLEVVGVLPSVV